MTAGNQNILLLHGYALDGSGSNVYINNLSKHLAELGHAVHIVCQERGDPPRHVGSISTYHPDGSLKNYSFLARPHATVRMHRPHLGPVLPVYNWDRYPGFDNVVTFVDLPSDQLEQYIDWHVNALRVIVAAHEVQVIHANHVVAMPEVARRVSALTGIPFVIMPHGSAIEYTVRRDTRYEELATRGLRECAGIIVGGDEMLTRIDAIWGCDLGHRDKCFLVPTGVDLTMFQPRLTETPTRPALESLDESTEGGGNSDRLGQALADSASTATTDEELLKLVQDHRNLYSARAPDADAVDKLSRIEFGTEKLIFFGGKLVAGKGVHTLIAALAELPNSQSHRLLIVGEGSFREALELLVIAISRGDHKLFRRVVRLGEAFDGKPQAGLASLAGFLDASHFAALHRRAKRHDLQRHVCFLGFLPHPLLAAIMAASDVVVLPSAVPEAYPLALVESLATGIVPLVTDHGGSRYFADQVAEGCQIPRSTIAVDADPRLTVACMTEALEQRLGKPRGVSLDARRLAERRYGWPAIARATANAYTSVQEKRAAE